MTWRSLIFIGAMIVAGLVGVIAGNYEWAWLLPIGLLMLALYVPASLWNEYRGRLPSHSGPRFFRR